jgi:transcription elongation factor GreA
MGKNYLSEERFGQLAAELEDLKTKKRLDVAERLKAAKEFGDLSENSEYTEAREEQQRVEQRIFDLEDFLKNAEIIKKAEGAGIVHVGSVITVTKGSKTFTYEIVGSEEADPMNGKISNESPLGESFMGLKVGDTVTVDTPAGEQKYKVEKIS